ncbi:MAG: FecR family protein [Opitutaceae bacterium]|nr:FecR family protein [Opitutaceae bacterium]
MNAPSTELIELCGLVRDEAATAGQIERLEKLLVNDPDARRFYRQFMQISAMLERYEQLPAEIPPATQELPPRGATTWRQLSPWFALAACVALVSALYLGWRRGPAAGLNGKTAPARAGAAVAGFIQEAHACVVIPRVGPPVECNGRFQLRACDIVTTAANGSAVIRFPTENTCFILTPDTRAWLSGEGQKIVHLASGEIQGDVAPQVAPHQWRIITADGEARVLGTRLAVSAGAQGTRVAVTSGRVRVIARDSRETVETPAGFAAQLTPTTARLTRLPPTQPTRVASFTVVNADTNVAIPGFEQLKEGAVLDLATLSTRRLNIRANCEPQLVGRVRLALSGQAPDGSELELAQPIANGFPNQIEIYYPYMLSGDPSFEGETLPSYSYPWTPPVGRYSLTATPYAGSKESGARGESLTVRFEVIDHAR